MAKYDTPLRNSRMAANQAAFLGGTVLLCQGAVPAALAAPPAGSILSRHPILGNGTVANGALTYADADLATDASADNGANTAPTYVVVLDINGTARAMYAAPSQIAITFAGGAAGPTAGQEVDIDTLTITEGNA